MAKTMAHIEMRRGYNNTAASKETALVVWHDAYEIKDLLKADGYTYDPMFKTWEKPAVDFIDSFTNIVIDGKLAPALALDIANEANAKGIALALSTETNMKFAEYYKAYYKM